MRDIKFRAWDKINKLMRIDFHIYAYNADIGMLFVSNQEMPFYKEMISDNYILMQYTGLLDKDGKDIYEGDIYKNPESIGLQKVIFHKGCFSEEQIIHIKGLSGADNFGSISSMSLNKRCEIIGNIYENPELVNNGR